MIQLTQEQQMIADAINDFLLDTTKDHLVIQGVAGSGKSILLDNVVSYYRQNTMPTLNSMGIAYLYPNAIALTATTNKALSAFDNHISGVYPVTIHRLLKLFVNTDYKTGETKLICKEQTFQLNNTIVIVDEYSQINIDLFNHIKKHMKPSLNNKFIFIGDKAQLSPVNEVTSPVNNLPNHVSTEMTKSYRLKDIPIVAAYANQVREFILGRSKTIAPIPQNDQIVRMGKEAFYADLLDKLRLGNDAKYISYTNQDVKTINKWIRQQVKGTSDYGVGERVTLTKVGNGMPYGTDAVVEIEAISNPTTFKMVDGRWFKFKTSTQSWFVPNRYSDIKKVIVNLTNREAKDLMDVSCDINYEYAITSYKSQGATYDYVYIDVSQLKIAQKYFWQHFYVAITRATKGVILTGV